MARVLVSALDILAHQESHCRKGLGFEDLSIKVSVIASSVLKLMDGVSVEAGILVESTFAGKSVLSWEAKVHAS